MQVPYPFPRLSNSNLFLFLQLELFFFAGLLHLGTPLSLNVDDLRAMFEVNTVGPLLMAQVSGLLSDVDGTMQESNVTVRPFRHLCQ